jgi:predicted nucleic acid-binding protein
MEATWRTVDEWIDRAARAGQRSGFGDLPIAALAGELRALVWSLDDEFARMSRLRFVGLYEP